MAQIAAKIHPIVQFRTFIDERAAELRAALPEHIPPEKFIRVVITAAQINPEIIACDRPSLWTACMRAANDGLLPDGIEGAIVPFKNKATWIPMYQGLLKKFRNSGEFKWITAGIVRKGDTFHHFIDEKGEHFYHQNGDEPGEARRVYAVATTTSGGTFIADMSIAEINKRRNMSRTRYDGAPWETWFEEMAKKTALRQLSKYLPKSSDIEEMLRREDDSFNENVESVGGPVSVGPADTTTALDVFGGKDTEAQETSASELPKDSGTVDAGDVAKQVEGEDRPAESLSTEEQIAYERGRSDRKYGVTKAQIDKELKKKPELAAAWERGWDGK